MLGSGWSLIVDVCLVVVNSGRRSKVVSPLDTNLFRTETSCQSGSGWTNYMLLRR